MKTNALHKALLWFVCLAPAINLSAQQPFPDCPPDSVDKNMHKRQMLWQLGIHLPQLPNTRTDPNRPYGTTPRYPDALKESPYGWTDTEAYASTAPRDLYFFRTDWGLWNNFREEMTGSYEPLDLLTADDGTAITTPELWRSKRAPELRRHCEEYIWGFVPAAADSLGIRWSADTFHEEDSLCGLCLRQDITGIIDTARYPHLQHAPVLKAHLWLPASLAKGTRTRIVIHIGECRPAFKQAILAEEWGYLQFEHQLLQADSGARLSDYLIGLVSQGGWRCPSDWGVIRAWSWGVSRLIDYLEREVPSVDASHCGLIGHSRLGKAAIAAAVFDTRITDVYACCSGCLGVSPVRRHFGEDLEFIPYYWFAGNMMRYCGAKFGDQYLPRKVADLPVDTPAFIALLAPRHILITTGEDDLWSDPYGAYLAARAATPVYRLLGAEGLVMTDARPLVGAPYQGGHIVFHHHTGGHDYHPQSLPAFIGMMKE